MAQKKPVLIRLAALFLITAFLLLTAACADAATHDGTAEPTSPRFRIEEVEAEGWTGGRVMIITDTETGVKYLAYKQANGVGLTKLEDKP